MAWKGIERNFTSTAESVGEKQGGTQAGNLAHRVHQRHARAAPQDRRARGRPSAQVTPPEQGGPDWAVLSRLSQREHIDGGRLTVN